MTPVRTLRLLLLVLPCVVALGCGRKVQSYSPHENLLSIAAEYQLLASQDPYAEEPARDLTGQNIARATLVRLANYESLHPATFVPEIQTLKARAYERLLDHATAARLFREAAGKEPANQPSSLKDDNLRRAALNEELARLKTLPANLSSLEDSLEALDRQASAFADFSARQTDPWYAALGRCGAEQSAVARTELLMTNRWVLVDGEQQALDALQGLVSDNAKSVRALEHALRLARFHREIAEQEMRLHPPTALDFDEDRAFTHIDQALDLLYRISQADGRPERLVAARELDTVLALREMLLERTR